MRLEQLEILISVADTHSMQKSAENLHTTIQNVSKSIKQLETELNISLFNRTRHGVFLTADGEFVYNEAKNVQQSIDSIKKKYCFHTAPPKNSLSGNLNILTCATMSKEVSLVSKCLRENYSSLNIANIVENPLTINEFLHEPLNNLSSYDIIITSVNTKNINNYKFLSNDFFVYFLREDRVGVHINSNHPYAKLQSVPLKFLLDIPLIALSTSHNNNSYLISIVEEETGITLKPSMWTNSSEKCTEFIKNGLGYGIKSFEDTRTTNGLAIIPLKEKIFISYLLIIPNHDNMPLQVQTFKDILSKNFKETFTRLF